jgi:hypothetical protein
MKKINTNAPRLDDAPHLESILNASLSAFGARRIPAPRAAATNHSGKGDREPRKVFSVERQSGERT